MVTSINHSQNGRTMKQKNKIICGYADNVPLKDHFTDERDILGTASSFLRLQKITQRNFNF